MIIRKTIAVLLIFHVVSICSYAQLSEGEVMFVGYNADGDNGVSIAAMVDIPANTTIYITDNEWNGSAIGSGGAFNNLNEGELTWTSGASVTPAGTVINMIDTDNLTNTNYGASQGTLSGTLDPNAGNEVLYMFLGTNDSTPTMFLSAIANRNFSNARGTLSGTNLTVGVNAIRITGNNDVLVYDGPLICDPAIVDCVADIADASNWITDDGGGNQSQNGNAPDFPDDVPVSFSLLLPIELISFEVNEFDEVKAELLWSTATEINNSFFTVERSHNAKNWKELALVEGAGNSVTIKNYTFLDSDPIYGVGYYRLKQTDYDGAYEYSEVVSFINKSNLNLVLYPNPSREFVTMQCENIYQADVKIFNHSGVLVNPTITNRGENKLQYNIGTLCRGRYIVRVILDDRVESRIFHKE